MKNPSLISIIEIIIFSLTLFIYSCDKEDNYSFINNSETDENFLILKADLHMHTYYSDGYLSPEERVNEAISEGFDVIAITDHIEYRLFTNIYPGDHNIAYKIAKEVAKNRLIIIQGTEITRNMPPGHISALFIKDANLLDKQNLWDVLIEAKKQNAYLIWNHPGWEAQLTNNQIKWHDYHTNMLKYFLLDGIEISNHKSFYKEAFKWAEEKGLAILASSDLHLKSSESFPSTKNFKRPYTLIISKDKSIESIRKSLNNNQVVAFFNDTFFCLNDEAANIFINKNIQIVSQIDKFQIVNKSTYSFTFIKSDLIDTLVLNGQGSVYVNSDEVFFISNFIVGEKVKYYINLKNDNNSTFEIK